MPKRKSGLAPDELAVVLTELHSDLESLRQLAARVAASYPESRAAEAFKRAVAAVAAFVAELEGASVPLSEVGVAARARDAFTFAEHREAALRLHQLTDSVAALFVRAANSYGVSSKIAKLGQRASRSITPLSLRLEDIVANEHPHDSDAYKVYSRYYVEKQT